MLVPIYLLILIAEYSDLQLTEVSFIPEYHLEVGQKGQKLILIIQLFAHMQMSTTLAWLQLDLSRTFGPRHIKRCDF